MNKQSTTVFSTQNTMVVKGLALIILLACHLFGRSQTAWSLFNYIPALMVDEKPLITALTSAGCGKVCVDIFVLLSGFGLNESFRSKYGKTFQQRVYVPYVFSPEFPGPHIQSEISCSHIDQFHIGDGTAFSGFGIYKKETGRYQVAEDDLID